MINFRAIQATQGFSHLINSISLLHREQGPDEQQHKTKELHLKIE